MANDRAQDRQAQIEELERNLGRVIEGKAETIHLLTIALIAGGSVLIEDTPGVGKTTLAKALAKSTDAEFNRVQFTPDLLPADILGGSIYNASDGTFRFRKGPIFCNILLADEINRASPRTQSALLEAQATIEGERHPLPSPFLVLATENPIEFHGTYPLPEAQLDRFLMRLSLGNPAPETEVRILYAQAEQHPLDRIGPVLSGDDLLATQQLVRKVRVEKAVARYIVSIVEKTRHDVRIQLGASPRGSLMIFRASQASAFSAGRDYVMPDDIQKVAPHILPHRLTLTSKAKYGGVDKARIIEDILASLEVPA